MYEKTIELIALTGFATGLCYETTIYLMLSEAREKYYHERRKIEDIIDTLFHPKRTREEIISIESELHKQDPSRLPPF